MWTRTMGSVTVLVLAAFSLGLGGTPTLHAGANFSEGFDNVGPTNGDGPQNLINQGWIFRNQSLPTGSGAWHAGYNDWFPPQAGAGYLAVESTSTDFFGGDVSQWAILPVIPGQQAGDTFTFYVRRLSSSNVDTMQLRYSPSGGTSTGSGPDAVGDFTTLLVDLNPIPLTGWTQVSASVPGTGRFAIRFYVDNACNFACYGSYVGLDELTVNQSPPPGPPLPGPGQTVHWTTDISPVLLGSDTTIVAGGTVIVDPAVQVRVQGTATLYVLGTIRFEAGTALDVSSTGNVQVQGLGEFLGTAAASVSMTGGQGGYVFAKGVQATTGGTVRLDYVNSDLPVYVHPDEAIYGETTNTIVIDHATFTGDGDVRSRRGSLAIRNSTFTGPTIEVQEGYLLLDAVDLNGSVLTTYRRKAGQPVYLDNLSAQNVTGDAPFQLAGFDYFFGPGNAISNSLYPVHLLGGGIAPGSTLPATGNTNNYVHGGVGEAIGKTTFANTGLPYRIDFDSQFPTLGGQLTIAPGVHVKFGPDAEFFLYVGGRLISEGTPDAPVVFEPLTPGAPWWGLAYDLAGTRPKLEHCIVRGAEGGVIISRCVLRMQSALLEENIRAARVGGSGWLEARKSRFKNNGTGVQTSAGAPPGFGSGGADLSGETSPNAFEGNGLALEVQDPLNIRAYATENWWGDATGPQHSSNPGGQGDPVMGLATVVPFRTAAPNFADHPPRVRIREPYFLLEEGQKVILSWSASDNSAIAVQRILYSPHSENPPLAVLIDNIPPGQRSIELTVPPAPPSSNIEPSVFRVVAVDDTGQEGWAEAMVFIPYIDFNEYVTPDPIVGEFRPGQVVDVCWQFSGGMSGTIDAYLFLDGDEQAFSLGGAHTGVSCLSLGLTIPPVSSDLARVGLRFNYGAGGRNRWEFGNYFTIRPDPAIDDAPPAVQLLTPAPGSTFAGGQLVPITWTASDDEGLRSFAIQAAYDGGRTWHVVAKDLPGTSTSYNWRLPASGGIPDARVRVIARDLRFQNSSDGTNRSFSVLPGASLPGDLNCDGVVNFGDIDPFVLALSGQATYEAVYPNCNWFNADVNGDGQVNFADIDPFVALLGG